MVFAIAKDVTDKKLAEVTVEEQYLKFKNLAAHFKDKIEKDRKYFAVELHEDLAQLASAIKLEIESLEMHTPDISVQAKEKIKNISDISHLMIDTIKRVAFTVSPYMLDDLGLQETMAWCCKEFSRLSNIL
jgi:signal transduction histidine kinase